MTETKESAWSAGLQLLGRLESAGHTAFLVGGCVRDRLLGRPLRDVDIATSARPEQVMELFASAIPTGLKHGTVTVREGGRLFEVTTYRREGKYTDSRRPDDVWFVGSIEEDLARRDFTINAIAFGSDGRLVDPFGGADDLRRGVIRTVGDPSERFGEDALRLLRGVRFAAEFGFDFAPDTWDGLLAQRAKLRHIAMERVGAELDKMAAGHDPERAFRLLAESGLLRYAREPLPACATPAEPQADSGERSVRGLADPDLRWAALLLRWGADEAEAEELFRTLRLGLRRGARVAAVVGLDRMLAADVGELPALRARWISAVLRFGRAAAEDWLALAAATAGRRLPPDVAGLARSWLDGMAAASVAELAVRGDEIVRATGRKPGPWVAATLRQLLSDVALGTLPNERPALLAAAEAMACDGDGSFYSKE